MELPGEFMMNALRLTKGFKKRLWMDRTGLEIGSIARQVETAEKAGLIYQNEEKIMPTEKGQMFLNNLIQYFL